MLSKSCPRVKIKVGVLLVNKENVLLIKEWSDNRQGFFWNFIKGTFEDSQDKTITECALREAKEEAGVKMENIKEIKWVSKEKLRKMNKEEFVSDVAYEAVNRWLKDKYYPLNLFEELVP